MAFPNIPATGTAGSASGSSAMGSGLVRAHPRLYFRTDALVFMLLYVDDVRLSVADIKAIEDTKNNLMRYFAVTDLGPASISVGIQVAREPYRGRIRLMQGRSFGSMLERFGIKECNTASTPSDGEALQTLKVNEKSIIEAHRHYQESVVVVSNSTGPDIFLRKFKVDASNCQARRGAPQMNKAGVQVSQRHQGS